MTSARLPEGQGGALPSVRGALRLKRNAVHGAEAGVLLAVLLLALVGAACAVILIGVTTLALLTAACLAAGAIIGGAAIPASRAWAALRRAKSPWNRAL